MSLATLIKKYYKPFLASAILLANTQISLAQNIQGELINRSNQTIPNKEIFVKTPNNQIIARTTTNQDGTFSFEGLPQLQEPILDIKYESKHPATDNITLSLSIPNNENHLLELFDVLGRRILTQNINQQGTYQANLNNQLAQGTYFLRLRNQTQIKTIPITFTQRNNNQTIQLNQTSQEPRTQETPLFLYVPETDYYESSRSRITNENLFVLLDDKYEEITKNINLTNTINEKIDGTISYSLNGSTFEAPITTSQGQANITIKRPLRQQEITLLASSNNRHDQIIQTNINNQSQITLPKLPQQYNFNGEITLQENETATISFYDINQNLLYQTTTTTPNYDINLTLTEDKIIKKVQTTNNTTTNKIKLEQNTITNNYN